MPNWIASQSAHPWNRIVRFVAEESNPGFLLSRTGSVANSQYWAMFNDAYTEHINPPEGHPRPDPDPAVRTKHQALPPTLRSGTPPPKLASMFTGQMRTVVQCEFSRGQESKFAANWNVTHGLLEFPQPHVTGADVAAESKARSQRRYFVIEISGHGVFAAPVTFGMTCANCALVNEYMLSGHTQLSLAGYYAENPNGKVQRVMTAEAIAPAFAAGAPWYGDCGWAFSYSGMKAANVVARGDNSAGFNAYLTTLLRLTFTVNVEGQRVASIVRDGNLARVTFTGAPHGLVDGDVAVVTGADQDAYNGAHIVLNATSHTFDFAVIGNPPSPATGNLKIANIVAPAHVSATLETAETGRVTFKRGSSGTLWVPVGPGQWNGVSPSNASNVSCSGPVHVFYDGEAEQVTRWMQSYSKGAFEEGVTPEGGPGGKNQWNGNATGTHALGTPRLSIPVQQSPTCEFEYDVAVLAGSGFQFGGHAQSSYGFQAPTFDGTVVAYLGRINNTAVSSPSGSIDITTEYGNVYTMCGGGVGSARIQRTETFTSVTMVQTNRSESAGGCSAMILFGEEREAVAILKVQFNSASVSTRSFTSGYRSRLREVKIEGEGEFTPIDVPAFNVSGPGGGGAGPTSEFSEASATGTFSVQGAGGFAYTKAGIPVSTTGEVTSGALVDFVRYDPNGKTTAQSTLAFMRGGLYYDEPDLVPRNQAGNRVFNLDGDIQTQGGFEQLNGKTPIGFVGRV